MTVWRRVTSSENARLHKAKAYTRAAPGKFRNTTKTISLRQYQKIALGGGKIIKGTNKATGEGVEQRAKSHRQLFSSIAQHKAMVTRGRNRELRELVGIRDARVNLKDNALINEYIRDRGYNANWSEQKKLQFRQLFYKYPDDLVRGWLGSSLENRRSRQFGKAA